MPPKSFPKTLCTKAFGPSGVCVLAKKLNPQTGAVITPVHNNTVTALRITGFPASGVFGYGTSGLRVTRVVAIDDGAYGIARFASTRTLFAHDIAIGNEEAGLYVGDSPHADTVVRDNHASGNQLGISSGTPGTSSSSAIISAGTARASWFSMMVSQAVPGTPPSATTKSSGTTSSVPRTMRHRRLRAAASCCWAPPSPGLRTTRWWATPVGRSTRAASSCSAPTR
ncbi:MAG TPA: right-handed parallel beta-helix repeat-containing protein [Streptosporangiaceae bacterium]|nr:right-handed parallel beta-helix repeat-containing protein [Streptosporangiaceae bacterium]